MIKMVHPVVALVATLTVIGSVLSGCGRAPPACPEPPRPAANVVLVPITVKRGKVIRRPVDQSTVRLGSTVVITVYSDVSDVIYIHGYECGGNAGPGEDGMVILLADKPGPFEIELEGAKLHVQLQVR